MSYSVISSIICTDWVICSVVLVVRTRRLVDASDVKRARDAGADDRAIHDTVLITAIFCMFNRYVDGLGTPLPDDAAMFDVIGARIAAHGYGSQFNEGA